VTEETFSVGLPYMKPWKDLNQRSSALNAGPGRVKAQNVAEMSQTAPQHQGIQGRRKRGTNSPACGRPPDVGRSGT
jgi:hypothetical protein